MHNPDDPRQLPGFKEAMAGKDNLWLQRASEYFVDIADDGFVIASGPEATEEEAEQVRKACLSKDWLVTKCNNCLHECTARGCACSRERNSDARDCFTLTAARRMAEVCQESEEVSYASLGCGFLRFDFCFLERLLELGVPVTAVHLVDTNYDLKDKGFGPFRVAIAQFTQWFATRNIDVYVHPTVEKFAFRVRQSKNLPVTVLQVDCSELTWVFDKEVTPMLEECLQYGGLFCSLTAREGTAGAGSAASLDAWGEVWRLVPETGRLKLVSKLRYRAGEGEKLLSPDEPLPKAVTH